MAGERAQDVFDIAAGAAIRAYQIMRTIEADYTVEPSRGLLPADTADLAAALDRGDHTLLAALLPDVMARLGLAEV